MSTANLSAAQLRQLAREADEREAAASSFTHLLSDERIAADLFSNTQLKRKPVLVCPVYLHSAPLL